VKATSAVLIIARLVCEFQFEVSFLTDLHSLVSSWSHNFNKAMFQFPNIYAY